MITTSFKDERTVFASPPQLFPLQPTIQAYVEQFTSPMFNIFQGLKNSVIISFFAMILSVVLSIPAAYGMARFRLKGKKFILLLFMVSQMLPQIATLVPNFIIFQKISIYNTYLAPIFADATLGIPFCILMLRTYFLSVPKEIDERQELMAVIRCSRLLGLFFQCVPAEWQYHLYFRSCLHTVIWYMH